MFFLNSRQRIKSNAVDKKKNILYDQIIKLNTYYASLDYPQPLRRIKYFDAENNKILVFLTDNFTLQATEIAVLYKHRWKIELFFKWIKQHLKIKILLGKLCIAVKSQIWIAISAYVLVAIAKKKFSLKPSLYEILQVISISMFEKSPIAKLFDKPIQQDVNEQFPNQLNIFD